MTLKIFSILALSVALAHAAVGTSWTFDGEGTHYVGPMSIKEEQENTHKGLVLSQDANLNHTISGEGRDLYINSGWGKRLILGTNPSGNNNSQIEFASPTYFKDLLHVANGSEDVTLGIENGSNFRMKGVNITDASFEFNNAPSVRITNKGATLAITEVDVQEKVHALQFYGSDFALGINDGRNQGSLLDQRALVHQDWDAVIDGPTPTDALVINYEGDFENGVLVNGVGMKINGKRPCENNPSSVCYGDATFVVDGTITATSYISTSEWRIPDYVFEKDYKLQSLEEISEFVKREKHLPEIPSAKEISAKGMDLTQMNVLLLKKVEELTLHAIRMNDQIQNQNNEFIALKKEFISAKEKVN